MPACSSVVMIEGYLYVTSGFNRHLFPKQGPLPRLDFMIYHSPNICRENPKKTVTAEANIAALARFIGTNYRRLSSSSLLIGREHLRCRGDDW